MNVDTPAPLNLSLANKKSKSNQTFLDTTCHVEAVKKIRKREFPRLDDMVVISFTARHWRTPTTKSLNPLLLFERLV